MTPRHNVLGAATILASFAVLAILGPLTRVGAFAPIGTAVAVAILLVALANPERGLIATVVLSLLVPITISVRVAGVVLSPGRLVGFAFLVGWVAAMSRPDGPRLRRAPLQGPLLAVVFAFLLSITANAAILTGTQFVSAVQSMLAFAVDYFLFFVAAVSVLGAGRRHLDRVLRTAALVVGFVAVLGIVEWLTGRNIFTFVSGAIPGRFGQQVGEVAEFVGRQRGGLRRVQATFEGPNRFGAVVVMTLPLLVHYWSVSRRKWPYAVGAVACALGGILTISRSVFIGLAVVVAVYLVASGRTRVTKANGLAVVAVVAVVVALNPAMRQTISFYFVDLFSTERRSVSGRLDDYQNVLRQFDETPLAGSGPGTYGTRVLEQLGGREQGNIRAQTVLDNSYLAYLAELGGAGFLALVSVMFGGVAVGVVAIRRARAPADRSLAAALLAGVTVFAIDAAFFDMVSFYGPMKIYLLFLAALAVVSNRSRVVNVAASSC